MVTVHAGVATVHVVMGLKGGVATVHVGEGCGDGSREERGLTGEDFFVIL